MYTRFSPAYSNPRSFLGAGSNLLPIDNYLNMGQSSGEVKGQVTQPRSRLQRRPSIHDYTTEPGVSGVYRTYPHDDPGVNRPYHMYDGFSDSLDRDVAVELDTSSFVSMDADMDRNYGYPDYRYYGAHHEGFADDDDDEILRLRVIQQAWEESVYVHDDPLPPSPLYTHIPGHVWEHYTGRRTPPLETIIEDPLSEYSDPNDLTLEVNLMRQSPNFENISYPIRTWRYPMAGHGDHVRTGSYVPSYRRYYMNWKRHSQGYYERYRDLHMPHELDMPFDLDMPHSPEMPHNLDVHHDLDMHHDLYNRDPDTHRDLDMSFFSLQPQSPRDPPPADYHEYPQSKMLTSKPNGLHHGMNGFHRINGVSPVLHDINEEEEIRYANRKLNRVNSTMTTQDSVMIEGNLTMLEYAMTYFRKSPYKYTMARGETGSIRGTFQMISSEKQHSLQRRKKKRSSGDWTWKEQSDMIKWTRSPIQVSLLDLSKEHNKIALECFINIMRYMGDYPLGRDMKTVDCVLFILMQCHNRRVLVDEIFCQLIKQTTSNKSTKSDSETMGWRMMAILTAFFEPTDKLQPYIFKYLESAAYDNRRSSQALAGLALENARKTERCGGRKNVPSKVELDAITRGRISKRQVCVLPGGAPVLLNIKSSNVVGDMLEQICLNLDMRDPLEREEYTIFYVIEKDNHYCPLNRKEYIFDITTELENQQKDYYLLFQRTSWIFPLHLEQRNPMCVDVLYHQCVPDYLEGFMVSVPNNMLPQIMKDEIALLGALLLRIMEKKGTPNQKDTASVIPQNVHQLKDMKLGNWTNQIYHRLFEVIDLSPEEAKVKFLGKLQVWPLFGSTFFNVKGVTDRKVKGECRIAINKNGINCLNPATNETWIQYPLQQIISTRVTTTDTGSHLDVKIGDLMQQKILQIDTEQSSDIAVLLNQYISLAKETLNR